MMSLFQPTTHELPVSRVIVHPLVLLSVVDHFNRMGKIGNQKRVVGVLLGSLKEKGVLDISNSFAGKFLLRFWILNKEEKENIT